MFNPFRRHSTPTDDPTGQHLQDHSEHQHYMHPTDHVLPQGNAVRGDEIVWVTTQVERHAQAGTLDEGNPHLLDAEIAGRHAQWDQAVDHEADNRIRTAKALHAEESEHLARLMEELREVRTLRHVARVENDHWRAVLHGHPITPPPATASDHAGPAVATARATGLTVGAPSSAAPNRPWADPAAPDLTTPTTPAPPHAEHPAEHEGEVR